VFFCTPAPGPILSLSLCLPLSLSLSLSLSHTSYSEFEGGACAGCAGAQSPRGVWRGFPTRNPEIVLNPDIVSRCEVMLLFFFFFTLVTGPRRSWSLKLSDERVYESQIRARLGTTAHVSQMTRCFPHSGPQRDFLNNPLVNNPQALLEAIP